MGGAWGKAAILVAKLCKKQKKQETGAQKQVKLNIGFGMMDEYIDDPLLHDRGNKNLAIQIRNNLNLLLEQELNQQIENHQELLKQLKGSQLKAQKLAEMRTVKFVKTDDIMKNVGLALFGMAHGKHAYNKRKPLAKNIKFLKKDQDLYYDEEQQMKWEDQNIEGIEEIREYDMVVMEADPDFENMVSAYCKGIIREKLCQTIQYKTTLSHQYYFKDNSDNITHIFLKNILQNDLGDEEIARQVWLAEGAGQNRAKYLVNLTYLKEISSNIVYYEAEYFHQKKIDVALNSSVQGNISKTIHSSFYQRQIFMDKSDYVITNVRQMSYCRLDHLIAERAQRQKEYSEEQLLFIIDVIARAIEEAKFQGIYHSNLTDERIIFLQDSNIYKVSDFMAYQLNERNEIDLTHENRDSLHASIHQQDLLFHSPELYDYFQWNVQNYEEQANAEQQLKWQEIRLNCFEAYQNILRKTGQTEEAIEKQVTRISRENLLQILKQNKILTAEMREALVGDEINLFKSDVFSLGVLSLHLMSLGTALQQFETKRPTQVEINNLLNFYMENGGIKDEDDELEIKFMSELEKQKKNAKKPGYPFVVYLIAKMLNSDPDLRPTITEIVEFIKIQKPIKPDQREFVNPDLKPQSWAEKNPQFVGLSKTEIQLKNLQAKAIASLDMQNFQDAIYTLQIILNQKNSIILNQYFSKESIIQAKFLLYYAYLEDNQLQECSIGLTNLFYEIQDAIHEKLVDYRFYKVLYYLAQCHFQMENFELALNYLDQLWDLCSERMINREYDAYKMFMQLKGMVVSDMAQSNEAVIIFKKIVDLCKVERINDVLEQEELIKLEQQEEKKKEEQIINQVFAKNDLIKQSFQKYLDTGHEAQTSQKNVMYSPPLNHTSFFTRSLFFLLIF